MSTVFKLKSKGPCNISDEVWRLRPAGTEFTLDHARVSKSLLAFSIMGCSLLLTTAPLGNFMSGKFQSNRRHVETRHCLVFASVWKATWGLELSVQYFCIFANSDKSELALNSRSTFARNQSFWKFQKAPTHNPLPASDYSAVSGALAASSSILASPHLSVELKYPDSTTR